jgi:HAD superfamily hydrolase (TIGR01484 family)
MPRFSGQTTAKAFWREAGNPHPSPVGLSFPRKCESSLTPARAALGRNDAAFLPTFSLCPPEKNLGIVDVLHSHCSKGAALQFLAASYGIRREEVMAIGDNHNDLEMLEFAGTGRSPIVWKS